MVAAETVDSAKEGNLNEVIKLMKTFIAKAKCLFTVSDSYF